MAQPCAPGATSKSECACRRSLAFANSSGDSEGDAQERRARTWATRACHRQRSALELAVLVSDAKGKGSSRAWMTWAEISVTLRSFCSLGRAGAQTRSEFSVASGGKISLSHRGRRPMARCSSPSGRTRSGCCLRRAGTCVAVCLLPLSHRSLCVGPRCLGVRQPAVISSSVRTRACACACACMRVGRDSVRAGPRS